MDIPEFAEYLNTLLERAASKPRCPLDTFNCGDTAAIIDDMTKDMSTNDIVGFVNDMSEVLNGATWREFVNAIRTFPNLAERFDRANTHAGEVEHLLEDIILDPYEGLGLPIGLQALHEQVEERKTIREVRASQCKIREAISVAGGQTFNAVFDRESEKIHEQLRKMENSEVTRRDNARRRRRAIDRVHGDVVEEEPTLSGKQLTKKQLGTLDEDINTFLSKVPQTYHGGPCTGACMASPATIRKVSKVAEALRREINDLKPILTATDKTYDFVVPKKESAHLSAEFMTLQKNKVR